MPISLSLRAAFAAASLVAPAVAAPMPDPASAAAPVPKLQHRSSLSEFKRQADTPPVDWKAANQLVEHIGGWRAYAREAAQGSAPAPAPAPAPATAPRR